MLGNILCDPAVIREAPEIQFRGGAVLGNIEPDFGAYLLTNRIIIHNGLHHLINTLKHIGKSVRQLNS